MRFLLACVVMLVLAGCTGASEPDQAAVQQPVQAADPAPEPEQESQPAESAESAPGATAELPVGTVQLAIDGVETAGSGVAFLSGEEVHVRLLVGPPNEYLQFDLITGDPGNGPIVLDPNMATVSTVYGGDAIGNDYTLAGSEEANSLSLDPVGEDHVSGSFEMLVSAADGTMSQMVGVFHIAASQGTDWDCNWTDGVVADCDFIAN